MESHSGNASDKKVLPEAAQRMNAFCANLEGVEDFLYVGDSAAYSNMLPLSSDMKWLSRVPENILLAKQLISKSAESIKWVELPDGYSYTVTESDYGSVRQRWVMIYSEQAYNREIKTLQRKPTQKPSMKWVYFLFSGVHELTIDLGGQLQQVVNNVNSLLKEILGYFGPRAREIYLNPA